MTKNTHDQIELIRQVDAIQKWVLGVVYPEPDEQQQVVDYCRTQWPDAVITYGYGETPEGDTHWVQILRNQEQ